MAAGTDAVVVPTGWCLYENFHKFKPGSSLGEFIRAYYSKEKEEFSLAEVGIIRLRV